MDAAMTGEAAPPPVVPAGDWRADDLDYAGMLAIIKGWAGKASGAPHKRFWLDATDPTKDAPYEQFMAYEFESPTARRGVRCPSSSRRATPAESNLLRALVGEPLIVTRGRRQGVGVGLGQQDAQEGEEQADGRRRSN